MNDIRKLVLAVIETARKFGLGNDDVNNAMELLDHFEQGLAFDTIITQLYEYEIVIDGEFYALIVHVAKNLKWPEEAYVEV